MAGDWIKMRCSLTNDPKVVAIGRLIEQQPHFPEWLSCNSVSEMPVCYMALRYIVTGALHVTWCTANEHARNGVVPCAGLDWIDLVTGIAGFGKAMESVGWAAIENGNLVFPKFDDNNTSGAERMRKWREKQKQKRDAHGNSNSDVSRSATVTSQVTLEKRREEKNREIGTSYQSNTNMSADADISSSRPKYSPEFIRFWDAFPRLRRTGKGNAWKAWKLAIRKAAAEEIIAAAAEYAASEVGRGQYVKGPAPWLTGEHWQDDRTAWSPSLARRVSQVPTDEDDATWNAGG